MQRRWLDAAIACGLALAVWIVYRKILRLWWMLDDPNHLLMLGPIAPYEIFTRKFTALLGKPLFTPLHFLSMKLDLMRFGETPRLWYLHQLIAFTLFPPLQYLMLRRWCSPARSTAAAVVTMLGVPTMNIVPVLMLRHYVEGAVFAVAAVALYGRGRLWNALSALLYLIAALYKEIFVPLPLILLALCHAERSGGIPRKEGESSTPLGMTLPHIIAAVIYAILRISLLGFSTESYDFVVRPSDRFEMLATLPFRAFSEFGIALAIAVFLCIVIVFVRSPKSRLVIAACAVAALLPIIPVGAQLQPRWAFALWLVSASAIAFVEFRIVIALVLITALASFRTEWPKAFRHFSRMSDEARVFAQLGPDDVLLDAETPPVTMQTLARVTHARGRAIYDQLNLCRAPQPHHYFAYDTRRRAVAATNLDCARIRTAPLFAHFVIASDRAFYWTLGPPREGRWTFVLGDDIAYDVPRDAGFRFAGIDALTIRVRYQSPAGWMTYSPDMRLDLTTPHPVDFERR